MNVAVRCPSCGKRHQTRHDLLGRHARCEQCRQKFRLVADDEETHEAAGETMMPARSHEPSATSPPSLASPATPLPATPPPRVPASPPGSVEDPQLPKKIARFEIRRRLGLGGFGTVYLAWDPVLEREVALKVPRQAVLENEKAKARFLREPKAAAQLRHPNIVPVFDAGQDDAGEGGGEGQFYIASAYIEGRTLEDLIEDDRPSHRRAAEIVRDLAAALDYAHRQGVVHRDVKPSNVMIDAGGTALLMDFGLARIQQTQEKLTHDGAVMGTPAYMAPEQADRDFGEVGPAADQYSLGVILYELLTGQRPFTGPPSVVIFNALHEAPKPPRALDPAISKDLETICLKAMGKASKQRFASCQSLQEELRRWLDGEPIRARPTSIAERAVRWTRKNPTTATLLGTILVLATVGIIAVFWQWGRAEWALAEHDRLGQSIEERQRDLDQAQSQLDQVESSLSDNQEKSRQVEESLAAKAKEFETAKESLAQAAAESEKAKTLVADLQTSRDALESQLTETRSQLTSEQESLRLAGRFKYVRAMQSASEAFSSGHFPAMSELLLSCVPSNGAQDIRSTDWGFLAQQWRLQQGDAETPIRLETNRVFPKWSDTLNKSDHVFALTLDRTKIVTNGVLFDWKARLNVFAAADSVGGRDNSGEAFAYVYDPTHEHLAILYAPRFRKDSWWDRYHFIMWNTAGGRILDERLVTDNEEPKIFDCAFSTDGNYLSVLSSMSPIRKGGKVLSYDCRVKVWELAALTTVAEFNTRVVSATDSDLLRYHGNRLFAGDQVLDLATKEVHDAKRGEGIKREVIELSQKYAAVGRGTVLIYPRAAVTNDNIIDLAKFPVSLFRIESALDAKFAPDQETLVVAKPGLLEFWDCELATRRAFVRFQDPTDVTKVLVTPDGSLIATSSAAGTTQLYEVRPTDGRFHAALDD